MDQLERENAGDLQQNIVKVDIGDEDINPKTHNMALTVGCFASI